MTSATIAATRAKLAATRCSLPAKLIEAYAEFYDANGASHELTISLGNHPRKFDPEVDFIPQMRRIVREISHRLRSVPKRKLLKLSHEDAIWMAGFYEATDASGMLFPHWHGVIALNEGEEALLRTLLVECVGEDATRGLALEGDTTRPLITTKHAKPTFDLQSLTSPERFIAYANKKVRDGEVTFWTTADFLPALS